LTPHGLNAIEYAANLVSHIQHLADQEADSGKRIEGFDVPFSTISTNTISGGNGMNIIPAHCEFSFEYRYLPGVDPDGFISNLRRFAFEQVLPRMKARHGDAAIEFECLGSIPALDDEDSQELKKMALLHHRGAQGG